MIGWIIGIVVAYVLSVLWSRYETKVYHGDELELTFGDAIFTLIPIVNLIVAFDCASVNGRWGSINIGKRVAKIYFGK